MFLSVCINVIISIIIIITIHYLITYFKDTFTTKIIKDVNTEIKKYQNILSEIETSKNEENELLEYANECIREVGEPTISSFDSFPSID